MEFFHGPCDKLKAVGTCQCRPLAQQIVNVHPHVQETETNDVEELNLWHLLCKYDQDRKSLSLQGHREDDVNHQGGQEARQLVHCPPCPAPSKYRSVHARERLQNILGLDVHEEAIPHAQPGRTSARRRAPFCRVLLSVPEVRVIVGHDLYPEVITTDMMSLISRRRG